MINVNMPVIYTASFAEFHQPVQLQPPQVPNTEGGGGAGPGGSAAFPTNNPPTFPTGGGGLGGEGSAALPTLSIFCNVLLTFLPITSPVCIAFWSKL